MYTLVTPCKSPIETSIQYPLPFPFFFQFPLMLPDLLAPAAPWLARGCGCGVAIVLSAREESAFLWHLVAVFMVGAEFPGHCSNHHNDTARNCRVGFPVRWLTVPTTGRRPDVLWVPRRSVFCAQRSIATADIRDLSTSSHCEVFEATIWGFGAGYVT